MEKTKKINARSASKRKVLLTVLLHLKFNKILKQLQNLV